MTFRHTIYSFPTNWPRDKRSTLHDLDGVMVIKHPEREPQKYDPATGKWSAL